MPTAHDRLILVESDLKVLLGICAKVNDLVADIDPDRDVDFSTYTGTPELNLRLYTPRGHLHGSPWHETVMLFEQRFGTPFVTKENGNVKARFRVGDGDVVVQTWVGMKRTDPVVLTVDELVAS
jgi:hypothetical protein